MEGVSLQSMKIFRKRRQDAAEADADQQELVEHPHIVHADPEQLDAETRALYLDAWDAAQDARLEAEQTMREAKAKGRKAARELSIRSPLRLGFTVTIGVLLAVVVGGMVASLSTVIMYVLAALFVALGLDPVVRWLESKKIKRPLGILIVFGVFVAFIATILSIIIPMITEQITLFVRSAPFVIREISMQSWFDTLRNNYGELVDFDGLLRQGQQFISDPTKWANVAGGIWKAGIGIANGLMAGLIVLILTLYFLSSLPSMKRAFYMCVSRSSRARVIDITEQITKSVGGFVGGMVAQALTNAVLGFIMMSIVGVPFAGLVAVGVFLLALIPLIGSLLATILVSLIALINSPVTALIAAIYYLVYMQIEAYVLSPRIMSRVVKVPGALVVIGTLAGGTLMGLLGALIAIPVTAAILMVIRQVWIPRQDLR